MNYLSGAINYISGTAAESYPSSIVPKLVDRVASSALPNDRREALSALAKVALESPDRQTEIGELAIKVLYAVLEQDKDYDDNIRAVLELLINICGRLDPSSIVEPPEDSSGQDLQAGQSTTSNTTPRRDDASAKLMENSAAAAGTNTDVFLGLPNAATLLLDLLEHDDVYIRCSVIELLTAMVANSKQTVQAAILEAPQAVARLTDLLDDTNRIVRTNATLLLSALVEESPEICKIVSFTGVMETVFRFLLSVSSNHLEAPFDNNLLDELGDPDALEAAILIQDGLRLILNLLVGSQSTQTFLRDSGCIQSLGTLFKSMVSILGVTVSSIDIFDRAGKEAGPVRAVGRQHYGNVDLGLQCITQLVQVGAHEATSNRSLCVSSGIFDAVLRLCFGMHPYAQRHEYCRLRIKAMACAGCLLRGHEETRKVFSSSIKLGDKQSRGRSPQCMSMDIMISDTSSALRAAGALLLRDSFISDPTLNLPLHSFLNIIVSGLTIGKGESSGRSFGMSADSSVAEVATTLKSTVVGWPNNADGPSVYYSADILGWMLQRIDGAKERMLGAYVSSPGDMLLPRAVRSLGQAVRQSAPPAVRIGLLKLLNIWLFQSSSAVSSFLSSAMHLPLIVELVSADGSQRDVASSHIQGLAAVLLGICLDIVTTDTSTEDSGFISEEGAATAFPRSSVADIVQNRIGITTFTARLDELRGTSAYLAGKNGDYRQVSPRELLRHEKELNLPLLGGELGHELWYDEDFVSMIDNVYSRMSSRVLHMVGDKKPPPESGLLREEQRALNSISEGSREFALVHSREKSNVMPGENRVGDEAYPDKLDPRTAPGDKDDRVIASYKELIRRQDKSLAEASSQIGDLKAAVDEMQREMDKVNSSDSTAMSHRERQELKQANAELVEKVSVLEGLLLDKESEFSALSNAYTALESEKHHDVALDTDRGVVSYEEVLKLRDEKESVLSQYFAECDKVALLQDSMAQLDSSRQQLSVELDSVRRERDILRGENGGETDLQNIAEWRRRAEVAESLASLQKNSIQQTEHNIEEARLRASSLEAEKEKNISLIKTLNHQVECLTSDAAKRESSKYKELSLMREAFASAEEVAQSEILRLRQQLERSREELESSNESANRNDNQTIVESLRLERDLAVRKAESLSAELNDAKNSVSHWERRSEEHQRKRDEALNSKEAACRKLEKAIHDKKHDESECHRLLDLVREAHEENEGLKRDIDTRGAEAAAALRKATDLEQRCLDLEKMRSRSTEEMDSLKEEVASRTEQTIRLSGQVYEADEARAEAESKLDKALRRVNDLESAVATLSEQLNASHTVDNQSLAMPSRSSEDEAYIASLNEEILRLKDKLLISEDACRSLGEKQNLIDKFSSEHDTLRNELQASREQLESVTREKERVQTNVRNMQNQILSLAEAEESKRVLTKRVIELQNRLVEDDARKSFQTSSRNTDAASDQENESLLSKISFLQLQLDEKCLRLKELEKSLSTFADNDMDTGKSIADLEKRLTESDALLSVVAGEKNDFAKRLSVLEMQLEMSNKERDTSRAKVEQLEADLLSVSGSDSSQEKERLLAEVGNLKDALNLCNEKLGVAEINTDNTVKRLEETLNELKTEKEQSWKLRESMASAESENLELKAALSDAAKTFKASARDLASREELLVELSSEKSNLARKLQSAEKAYQDLHECMQDLEKQLKDEINNLKAQLDLHRGKVAVVEDAAAIETSLSSPSPEELPCIFGNGTIEKYALPEAEKIDSRDLAAVSHMVELISSKLSRLERQHIASSFSCANGPPAPHVPKSAPERAGEQPGDSDSAGYDSIREFGESRVYLTQLTAESKSECHGHEGAECLQDCKSEAARLAVERTAALEAEIAGRIARFDLERNSLLEAADAQSKLIMAKSEEICALQAKLQTLECEMNMQMSAGKSLEDDKGALQAKVFDAEVQLSTMNAEIENLKRELHESITSEERVQNEHANANKALAERIEQIAASEKVLDTLKLANAQEVGRVNNELHAQRNKYICLNKEYQEFKEAVTIERENNSRKIADLELDVDSQYRAVEAGERQLRDLRTALKTTKTETEKKMTSLEEHIKTLETKLRRKEDDFQQQCDQSTKLRSDLEAQIVEMRGRIRDLEDEKSQFLDRERSLSRELTSLNDQAEKFRESSVAAHNKVTVLQNESNEHISHIDLLHIEVGKLEDSLLLRKEDLSNAAGNLKKVEETLSTTVNELKEANLKIENMGVALTKRDTEIQRLRDSRGRLEEENESLRSELDAAESATAAAQRDMLSMKAWINDLEQKTGELQTMADRFEDVERTLDETVGAHTLALQTSGDLTQRLAKTASELEDALEQIKILKDERNATEKANLLAKEQLDILDSRMGEIRDSHTRKVAAMEERGRQLLQRCTDLEAEVASAERNLATKEAEMDKLLACEGKLTCAMDELEYHRSKAETTEQKLASARKEITQLENELEVTRGLAEHKAFAELEAEHNELLLYLADLELEYTVLKESATIAVGTRTADSLSAIQ